MPSDMSISRDSCCVGLFCLMTHRYFKNLSFYLVVLLTDFVMYNYPKRKNKLRTKANFIIEMFNVLPVLFCFSFFSVLLLHFFQLAMQSSHC